MVAPHSLRLIRWLSLGVFFTFLLPKIAFSQRMEKQPNVQALSKGQHCLGEEKQKLLLEHFLAGSINPLGIGNTLRLSLCTPLVTKPGILFDLTNVEFGINVLTSPTDVSVGPFINVTPLSFLVLRAEAYGFGIWPIPLQGAGFISLNDSSQFTIDALSPSPFGPNPAGTAGGGRVSLGATLRGEVALGRWLSLAFADGFNGEYWRLTDATWDPAAAMGRVFFYIARRDVILLGPGDWMINNTAALVLGIKPTANVTIRVGATDDLVYTPNVLFQGTPYLGNVAAGIIAVSVKNLRNLAKEGSFFLRAGTFTNHAFRTGITFALGFDVTYELFTRELRKPKPPEEPPGTSPAPPDEPPAGSPRAPRERTPRAPAPPSEPRQPSPPAPVEPVASPSPAGAQ